MAPPTGSSSAARALVACLAWSVVVSSVAGLVELNAESLLQGQIDGKLVGSHLAAALSGDVLTSPHEPLSRRVLAVGLDSITSELLTSMASDNYFRGLLILLEPSSESPTAQALAGERALLDASPLTFAVYAALRTPELERSLANAADPAKDPVFVSSTQKDFKAEKRQALPMFQLSAYVRSESTGVADAATKNAKRTQPRPLLAVVAPYDTLSLVPGVAAGARRSGLQIAVLLDVMRRVRAMGAQNLHADLLFALTADAFKFRGSAQLLNHLGSDLVDTLAGVVYLDDLRDADRALFLHHAPMKADAAKTNAAAASATALETLAGASPIFGELASALQKQLGVPVEARAHAVAAAAPAKKAAAAAAAGKKKAAKPRVSWAHERFAARNVPAVTLSSSETPRKSPMGVFTSLTDLGTRGDADVDLVGKLSAALAQAIFSVPVVVTDLETKADVRKPATAPTDLQPDAEFAAAVLGNVTMHPRFAPFMGAKGAFLQYAQEIMKSVGSEFAKPRFATESRVALFQRTPQVVQLEFFRQKPVTFDIFLTFGLAALLVVVHLCWKSPRSLDELKAALS